MHARRLIRTAAPPAFILILALLPAPAGAATFRHSHNAIVAQGETIDDDLYVFGETIEIAGTVRGDLVAFGREVTISGHVEGDVLAGCKALTITGSVSGTVRAGGERIATMGEVSHDLLAAGREVLISANGRAGRDAIIAGNDLAIQGHVGRNAYAAANALAIAGPIGGDVRADVNTLDLGPKAEIGGDLRYESDHEATKAPGAVVRGTTERTPREHEHRPGIVGKFIVAVIVWTRSLIGLFAFGLLLLVPFAVFTRRAVTYISRSGGMSVGVGIVLLVGIPFIACTAFIFGILIGGWWIGLGFLGLYVLLLALAYTVAAIWLGERVIGLFHGGPQALWLTMLIGLAVLLFIGRIPILGGIIGAVAVVFGLGAMALALRDARGTPMAPPA
jgi:cytoskeletal protein CcmA (bactofilin family)